MFQFPITIDDNNRCSEETERLLSEADGWLTLGMPEEASRALYKINGDEYALPPVKNFLIQILLRLERWRIAENQASDAFFQFPDQAIFLVYRIFALERINENGMAYRLLTKPPNGVNRCSLLINLALVQLSFGFIDEARDTFILAKHLFKEEKLGIKYPALQRLLK